MHSESSGTTDMRVASVDGIASVTTGAALALGIATVVATVLSGVGGLAVFLGLLFLVSLLGSAVYVGARRTASATFLAVDGDRVLAQGIGRGGHGFLGAHVVSVTSKSILSVSVRPWSVGRTADAISLSQVSNVETGSSFLRVDDEETTIALKACPPPQVAALLGEIRQRTGTEVD